MTSPAAQTVYSPAPQSRKKIVALVELGLREPSAVILDLAARTLRHQRVADAQRQRLVGGELGDRLIVLRIVLPAAARIDQARDAEPVELAHHVTRGDDLIFRRQLGHPREHAQQADQAGGGDHEPGGIAGDVARDQPAHRIGGVAAEAERAQPRFVDEGAIIQMHDETGHVARRRVDLVERRQPLFLELVWRPTADHLHPVRRRRAARLLLQHLQRKRERRDPVPADLLRIGQPAADEMRMCIIEAGDERAFLRIDDAGRGAAHPLDLAARTNADNGVAGNRDRLGVGQLRVERDDLCVFDDGVGGRILRRSTHRADRLRAGVKSAKGKRARDEPSPRRHS